MNLKKKKKKPQKIDPNPKKSSVISSARFGWYWSQWRDEKREKKATEISYLQCGCRCVFSLACENWKKADEFRQPGQIATGENYEFFNQVSRWWPGDASSPSDSQPIAPLIRPLPVPC